MKLIVDQFKDEIFSRAFYVLLQHRRADLIFDDHIEPIKYTIQSNGELLIPTMVAMMRATSTTLVVPEDSLEDMTLQLQITLNPFKKNKNSDNEIQKWHMYHGDSPDVNWASVIIDGGKIDGHWVDGESLMVRNPLENILIDACKTINSGKTDLLTTALKNQKNLTPSQPKLVGIDPWGLDIRGEMHVFRLDAKKLITSISDIALTLN